jgi:hypothetical protein
MSGRAEAIEVIEAETMAPVAFIVKFARIYYFTGRNRDGSARGTWAASFATAMTYLTACGVARSLRSMGHRDAVVTNLYGHVILPEEALIADPCASDEFKEVWAPDEN